MFNHTITIYNRRKIGREDVWQRTVLEGVHYENVHGVKLGDRSIQTDGSTEIVIPMLEGFLKPKAYQVLSEHEWEKVVFLGASQPISFTGGRLPTEWTLAPNDKVVLGRVDQDITSELELDKYDDVRTIESYDVVDYASDPTLNNITVVAK